MCAGETLSEGGFAPNRVSAASLLEYGTQKDKKGKTYYTFEILTRTGTYALVSHTVRVSRSIACTIAALLSTTEPARGFTLPCAHSRTRTQSLAKPAPQGHLQCG